MTTEPSVVNMLPSTRWARWLTGSAVDVPPELRARLLLTYLTSIASLVSGTAANLIVIVVALIRHPIPQFYVLALTDVVLIVLRVVLLRALKRAAAAGTHGPTDFFVFTSLAWAALLGAGTYLCFKSGDNVLQVVAPVTMVAMVGGVATRNYGVPRLAILQIIAMDLPYTIGVGSFWADPWLLVVVAQFPLYVVSMISTVFRLHRTYLTVAIAERENERRATHDALTGLRNRAALITALKHGLAKADPGAEPLALFYLDLDGFKAINDVRGHAAGDRLLQLVAGRLQEAMPPDSIVARMGGDEFVILLPAVSRDQAEAVGGSTIEAISAAYDLGEAPPALIGVSIGLALAELRVSAEDLLARADDALYRAKAGGKGRLVVAPCAGEGGICPPRQQAA